MAEQSHVLQCFEIFGGNDAVDRAVSMPGLDAWVLSKPHGGDASGGDIHYLSSCATGRIGRVLLADVSGHGLAVSQLALRLRGLMRQFVNYVDHTKLVEKLNQEFAAVASPGMFATAAVLTWWAPTGEVVLTSAGHPPALLFVASRNEWMILTTEESRHDDASPDGAGAIGELRDAPLGIIESTRYDRMKVMLQPGDMLLLYSDALIEARDDADREIGVKGLLGLASSTPAGKTPQTFASALLHKVSKGAALADDATLLLIRRSAVPVPKASVLEGLQGTWRVVREAVKDVLAGRKAAMPEVRADNLLGAYADRFNKPK